MPLAMGPVDVGARRIGLVVVDEINGFATVGAGNLVPPGIYLYRLFVDSDTEGNKEQMGTVAVAY